jgi:AcrR family transcriptional regulator
MARTHAVPARRQGLRRDLGGNTDSAAGPGRPRSREIDAAILKAAQEHLARDGYQGMSLARIAEAAGSTRQALYRRWPGKAELAADAVAALIEAEPEHETADVEADLVAELESFRHGVSRPNGLSLVGVILQAGSDDGLRILYQDRVVAPRRRRLLKILERAGAPADDSEIAASFCTGSFYALALAGRPIPEDWAERTARMVLTAVTDR